MVKRQLDEKQTVKILQLRQTTRPERIASLFDVSTSTIYRKFKNYDTEERWSRRKTTRRRSTDTTMQQNLVNFVRDNPFHTLFELKCHFDLDVSESSISRLLKSNGLQCYVSPKKFLIKPVQAALRVDVASLRKEWSVDVWKTIVFTDESGLDNSGYIKRYVRRPKKQKYHEKYIYKHINANHRVNFFSWVTKDGTGDITFYKTMNSELYCETVTYMIEILREHYGENFLVVHDNARFTTSRYTVEFFANNDLNKYFVAIPTYSPDMNLIENLWALLKRRVRENIFNYGSRSNLDQFRELIVEIWSNIEIDIIQNLFNSMPNRMHLIIESQGQLSRY